MLTMSIRIVICGHWMRASLALKPTVHLGLATYHCVVMNSWLDTSGPQLLHLQNRIAICYITLVLMRTKCIECYGFKRRMVMVGVLLAFTINE